MSASFCHWWSCLIPSVSAGVNNNFRPNDGDRCKIKRSPAVLDQIHDYKFMVKRWSLQTWLTIHSEHRLETCASRPIKKCKTRSKLLPEMSLNPHKSKASRTACELYDRAEVQKFRHLKSLLQEFKPRRQNWITFDCLGKIMMGRRGDKFDVNNLSLMFPLPLF